MPNEVRLQTSSNGFAAARPSFKLIMIALNKPSHEESVRIDRIWKLGRVANDSR